LVRLGADRRQRPRTPEHGVMRSPDQPSESGAPPWIIVASDEEVVLRVPGFAVLRASYEAEGYYDEAANGDPVEQDLYRVEVLDAPLRARAAEALEGEPVGSLTDLGLSEPALWRLLPSARWAPESDPLGLVKRYLRVLAHALRDEERPGARQRLLESSAGWAPEVIGDAFQCLPPEWRGVLLP
jgi:hypothetical protein